MNAKLFVFTKKSDEKNANKSKEEKYAREHNKLLSFYIFKARGNFKFHPWKTLKPHTLILSYATMRVNCQWLREVQKMNY